MLSDVLLHVFFLTAGFVLPAIAAALCELIATEPGRFKLERTRPAKQFDLDQAAVERAC